MDEDIHNEDEYFKRAYEQSEEDASPEVWKKVMAALDQEDAVVYRRKYIAWRWIACLVLLLSGSALSYYCLVENSGRQSNTATGKSDVSNNQVTTALAPSIDSSHAAEGNKADSIQHNYALTNKKTIAIHATPLHPDENQAHVYHPQLDNKNRKQNTEPLDYSSVTQVLHQHKPSFEWKENAEKNLLKRLPATAMAKLVNSDVQPIDSSKNAMPADGIADNKTTEKIVTESIATGGILLKQDSANPQQNAALQKQTATSRRTTSYIRYLTVTPFFSADFTHNKLDNDALENSGQPEDKSAIQKRERQEFSYAAGIVLKLPLNRQWGIKTGAIYSNIAIGIQPQKLYAAVNGSQGVSYKFITSSGYAYVNPGSGIPIAGDSINTYISQHHLQYLNIPALLSYNLLNKKRVSLSVAAGISTNFLLSTSVETEVDDDNNNKAFIAIHKLQGLRPLYFSYVADGNVQFYMNKHLSFTVLPSFKYAITPINKNNVVKTFPYSVGIGAGITYRL